MALLSFDALLAVPFVERDAFVDRALGFGPPPDDGPLPRGSVPYIPCGVDAIVHAVREAPVTSRGVFVDLGAGVGRALVVAHLLSGARAVGVELQPHLVAEGRAHVARLGLEGAVRLVEGDAGACPVPEGTVFFIYASFGRDVLSRVLAWLLPLARDRRVTLCAVGFEIDGVSWLEASPTSCAELVVYRSARR
jgi:SAM-dependent methyltransferase